MLNEGRKNGVSDEQGQAKNKDGKKNIKDRISYFNKKNKSQKNENGLYMGGCFSYILLLLVLFGIVVVIIGLNNGFSKESVKNSWKSSPDEVKKGINNSMNNSADSGKRANQSKLDDINGTNKAEKMGSLDKLKKQTNIYNPLDALDMNEAVYGVYVYTDKENMDKEFDKWFKGLGDKVKVYSINYFDLDAYSQTEMAQYLDKQRKENGEVQPAVFIVKRTDFNKHEIDRVVYEESVLNEIEPYLIESLKNAKDIDNNKQREKGE